MRGRWRFILVLVVGLCWCGWAAAEVRVEFPLGDYYRPGRYVPVRIVAAMAEAPARVEVRIMAEGAVPTVLLMRDGHADAVAPWLVMRAPLGAVAVEAGGATVEHHAPRRPVAANERLVGYTIEALQSASELFPDQAIIPISLDPVDPLPGHPAAWEALDAVLLDEASYRRLRRDAAAVLLSAGTVLAVRAAEAPDAAWPWVRFNGHWVMRMSPAGPAGTRFDERYYEPAHAWRAEWPAAFRRQALLLGVLAGCLMGAAGLWRSRYAPAGVVVAAGVCVAGSAVWRNVQMPVPDVRGDVLVQHEAVVQRDAWHYQAAIEPAEAAFAWRGLSRPMLAGSWHLAQMQLALRCDSDGEPLGFAYHLPRGMRIAFLAREMESELPADEPRRPITSPMERIVRTMYLGPRDELVGEIAEQQAPWRSVVLRRAP